MDLYKSNRSPMLTRDRELLPRWYGAMLDQIASVAPWRARARARVVGVWRLAHLGRTIGGCT